MSNNEGMKFNKSDILPESKPHEHQSSPVVEAVKTANKKEKPNLVETPNPPTPTTKVISKATSKTEKEKGKDNEKDTTTIPTYQYDELRSQVNNLTQSLKQTKIMLYNIQDALTMVQSTVLKAKNSI